MTLPNAIDQEPVSRLAELVTFEWTEVDVSTFAESTVRARYAAYTSGLNVDGDNFEAMPAMKVGDITTTISLTPQIVNIELPIGTYPFDKPDEPLGEMLCMIDEVDPSDHTTRRPLWMGYVVGAVANPSGNEELIRVELESLSRVFRRTLGISCDTGCAWALGDKNCCIDLAPLKKTLAITSVEDDRYTINVTGLDPDLADGYWADGFIQRKGGRIRIHSYTTAGQLILARPLPAAWVGLSVMAVPGCDGSRDTCDNRYSNLERFGGFGHGMLQYNPSFGFGGKD